MTERDNSRNLNRRDVLKWTAGVAVGGAALALGSNAFAGATAGPFLEESGHIDVPGGKVWWMRVGSGPKTPLLLVHGGPGAGHNYLLPLKVLADERPVIFYDQLGCGRSDISKDPALYTVARSVQELDAVRKALGLDRIVLFGQSWGAQLAMEYFATRGGPGVERLALCGAYASSVQFSDGTKRLQTANEQLLNRGDVSSVQDLIAPSYVVHVRGTDLRALDTIRQSVTELRTACPDLHVSVQVVDGDRRQSCLAAHPSRYGQFSALRTQRRAFLLLRFHVGPSQSCSMMTITVPSVCCDGAVIDTCC